MRYSGYVLLGATLFGIVVVSILLVYVANDAIQPLTADPGWLLTFFPDPRAPGACRLGLSRPPEAPGI